MAAPTLGVKGVGMNGTDSKKEIQGATWNICKEGGSGQFVCHSQETKTISPLNQSSMD